MIFPSCCTTQTKSARVGRHRAPASTWTRKTPKVATLALLVVALFGVHVTDSPAANATAASSSVVGLARLRSPLQTATRLRVPDPPPPAPTEVQLMLDSTNAERTAAGLAPLAYSDQLSQAASAHAADQFGRLCPSQLSHTGTDGSNTGVRISRTGLTVRNWAENVACGQPSVDQVMWGWMTSPGHRANILNPELTHIGISFSYNDGGRTYWVQVFGTPR